MEKFFQIAAIGMMTSLIMPIFLKNYGRNGSNMFFFKINLVTARKKIFEIFFQLLKVKITYKLNIYIYIG